MSLAQKDLISQYVVFNIEEEEYGIEIKKVTGIEKDFSVTRVPKVPEYINGVINLRGNILPIIDLRKRFHLPEKEIDHETRIIVVRQGEAQAGIVVDSVSEVVKLQADKIENLSSIDLSGENQFLSGVGNYENKLINIIDLENLLNIDLQGGQP